MSTSTAELRRAMSRLSLALGRFSGRDVEAAEEVRRAGVLLVSLLEAPLGARVPAGLPAEARALVEEAGEALRPLREEATRRHASSSPRRQELPGRALGVLPREEGAS